MYFYCDTNVCVLCMHALMANGCGFFLGNGSDSFGTNDE